LSTEVLSQNKPTNTGGVGK